MAMAQAQSASVTCSGPMWVVLISHSYVRRLQEYCEQQAELQNLRFPCQNAVLQSFSRGSATVWFNDDSRWINCQLQPALGCSPVIVFLHVGENDIRHLEADVLVDQLWALVQYIRAVAHPRVIIICQLLWFPAYEQLQNQIAWVNHRLETLIVPGVPPSCHFFVYYYTLSFTIFLINIWNVWTVSLIYLLLCIKCINFLRLTDSLQG